MTYTDYIKNYIGQQQPGEPIFTEMVSDKVAVAFGLDKKKAAAATAVAVKRIMDKDCLPELRCYRKGVYYRAAATPFGETGINREKLVAVKYLLPDKGYETGLYLLHHMGLTTQMPTEHLFATNAAQDCVRHDKKLGVSVCPPKTPVTAENKPYLQVLDALDLLDKAPVDAADPYAVLADHIDKNGLQYEVLLYYADRYYNKKTILRLAHVAGRKEVTA